MTSAPFTPISVEDFAASARKFLEANAERKQVKDLPLDFVLDDSMGMVPSTKLSDFPTLIVGARVSLSGNATPSAGDWEGVLDSVPNGSSGLKLKISSQRR